MPPPRAVARHTPPRQAGPGLSDLTTTMPILAVPSDDGYDGTTAMTAMPVKTVMTV